MSNQPTSGEAKSSEPAPSEEKPGGSLSDTAFVTDASTASSATVSAAEFGPDAAAIVAALGRMEETMRRDRAALDRMQLALREATDTIAQAKAALDSQAIKPDEMPGGKTVATFLDELEYRVDAMLEIAGGVAGAQPAAAAPKLPPVAARPESTAATFEPDAAPPEPIVAMSEFDAPQPEPSAAMPEPAAAEVAHDEAQPEPAHLAEAAADEPAAAAPDRVPTVSSVVSRLGRHHDDAPADRDTPAPGGGDVPTFSMLEAMVEALNAAVPVTEQEASPQPPAAETPDGNAADDTADDAADDAVRSAALEEPAGAEYPDDLATRERDLLASIAQLEAFPFMPADEGAAVIFTSRATSVASGPLALEPPPAGTEPADVELAAAPEPLAALQAALQALERSLPPREAALQSAASFGSQAVVAPELEEAGTVELPFDSAAFLSSLEAEAGAFQPQAATERPLEAEPEAVATQTVEPPADADSGEERRAAQPAGNSRDPLAPLKAMSEEEKIALFS